MSNEEARKLAISNFITKICALERQIELKRQTLCDRNDFEPYVAFQRLLRTGTEGVTSSNIVKFLSENLIDVRIADARNLLLHYDNDGDGLLSYKEFLEIVLPKEHPDLRAFVTQRECFAIKEEEYLSYETEAAMAVLFALEVGLFENTVTEKQELDRLALSGHKIVQLIDQEDDGNLNFNNLQKYLHESGLMPYDSEIINFLRRIDRDDDGVITGDELAKFLEKFNPRDEATSPGMRRLDSIREDKLKTFSPNRKIVRHKYVMFSPEYGRVKYPSKEDAMKGNEKGQTNGAEEEEEEYRYNAVLQDVTHKMNNTIYQSKSKAKVSAQKAKDINQTPKIYSVKDASSKKDPMDRSNLRRKYGEESLESPTKRHYGDDKRSSIAKRNSIRKTGSKQKTETEIVEERKYPTGGYKVRSKLAYQRSKERASSRTRLSQKFVEKEEEQRPAQGGYKRESLAPTISTKVSEGTRMSQAHKSGNRAGYQRASRKRFEANLAVNGSQKNEGRRLSTSTRVTEAEGGALLRRAEERSHGHVKRITANEVMDESEQASRLNASKVSLASKRSQRGYKQGGAVPRDPKHGSSIRRLSTNLPVKKGQYSPSKLSRAATDYAQTKRTAKPNYSPSKSNFRASIDNSSLSRPSMMNTTSTTTNHSQQPQNPHFEQSQAHQKFKKKQNPSSNTPLPPTQPSKPASKTATFAHSFHLILQQERRVEAIRKTLASQPDFYPSKVFEMIPQKIPGAFSFEEFREFLNKLGLKRTNAKTIIDFYSSFDINEKRRLEFHQLVDMISPHDPAFSDLKARAPPQNFENFSVETLNLLKDTFETVLDAKNCVYEAKKALREKGVEVHQVFDLIDYEQRDELGKAEFERFLFENVGGYSESVDNEIDVFLKACDMDKDGVINFKDFYMFFSI